MKRAPLATKAVCLPSPEGSCALCGDEARAARILRVDRLAGTAEAEVEGTVAVVALDLVDDAGPGDVVLVHQGFAIARVGSA